MDRDPIGSPASRGTPRGAGDPASPDSAAEAVDLAEEVQETGEDTTARPSRRLEIVCALSAAAGTATLIVLARQIRVRTETGGIDPRWWPEMLGIVGLVLSLLLCVVVLRSTIERDELETPTREGGRRLALALVLTVAFVLLWPVVGFLVATPLFLVALTALFGGRGWKTLIVFPVAMTVFIQFLFGTLLRVAL